MSMCCMQHCSCPQHRMLSYLKHSLNDEAKLILQNLGNLDELFDASGRTLLHYAVGYRNVEMIRYLIEKGCNVEAQDGFGQTPLMLAVSINDEKSVDVLLRNTFDIFKTDYSGSSIFELARANCYGQQKNNGVLLKMFIDKVNCDFLKGGLFVQRLLTSTNIAMYSIVAFGSLEVTQFLLANGYQMDYRDPSWGYTALHCAVLLANVPKVKLLLEHGADVDSTGGTMGNSIICDYISGNCEDADEHSEVLKWLLSRSTRLAISSCERDFTPVEFILMRGKKKSVRTLLLSGIHADAYMADGRTFLSCLAENRNEGVFDLLLELNVSFDVNQVDGDGYSALMATVQLNGPGPVEFLLRQGADVNFTAPDGHSAATLIDISPNQDSPAEKASIVQLLLQFGAEAPDDFLDHYEELYEDFDGEDHFSPAVYVLMAHAAMLEVVLGESQLTDLTRNKIESHPIGKARFESCFRQLEQMKSTEVYGSLTLFKLLTATEEEFAVYSRNRDFFPTFKATVDKMPRMEAYYVNYITHKHYQGLALINLQSQAATVIGASTGLCTAAYYHIVYKIIDYLSKEDLITLTTFVQ